MTLYQTPPALVTDVTHVPGAPVFVEEIVVPVVMLLHVTVIAFAQRLFGGAWALDAVGIASRSINRYAGIRVAGSNFAGFIVEVMSIIDEFFQDRDPRRVSADRRKWDLGGPKVFFTQVQLCIIVDRRP